MKRKRSYSAQFKAEVVLEALQAEKNQAQICRERGIGADLLSKWRQHFLENASELFRAEANKSADQGRIAELERLVGQLTVELDLSKKLSELASSRYRRNGK